MNIGKTFRAVTALCIALIMTAGCFQATFAVDRDNRQAEGVLFKSSFESNEDAVSGEIVDLSGVIKANYGVKGKGLAVRMETVAGSADYLGSENKYNLFDGKTATKFLTAGNTAEVRFALKEPAAVNCYEIATANDEPTRDPKSWTFYGSNDGTAWTKLDTRSNVSFGGRFATKKFSFVNETVYEWYKLDVTQNCGASLVQFSSLDLYVGAGAGTPEDPEESVPSEIDASAINGPTAYSGHSVAMAFDGSVSSKYVSEILTEVEHEVFTFRLASAEVITHYALSNGDDHLERDPRDWSFYGSNNGSDWTLLDTRSYQNFGGAMKTKAYGFENGTAYLWFKLDITAVVGPDTWFSAQGNGDRYLLHLSEVEVFTEEHWHEPAGEQEEVIDGNGPFTVVKSSVKGTNTVSEDESKEKLFDGEELTKATFTATTAWVSFRVNRADAVTAYSITSANDWANRDPENWTLYGSQDGETWTAVDSREGIAFSTRFEEKIFRLSSPVSYLWYKFDVTKNGGNDTYTQFSELKLMTSEDVPEALPGMDVRVDFGPTATENGKPGAWTGSSCLAVYGEQSSTENTYARAVVFDGLQIPVSAHTTFSYLVFPGLFNNNSYDYEYTSCRVILDLHFTDGSVLSGLGVRDQNGSTMSPAGQIAGECLVTGQWNYVEGVVGTAAEGKTVDRIDAYFEMANAEDASKFITFFDDVKIEDRTAPVYEHLSDYITILRGTNNDQAYSRGLCTPAVTVPNGYNFYSPVTNPNKPTASYNYQVNGDNNPLDSVTVIHAPSYWLSSYGTWQFMANTSVAYSGSLTAEDISSGARAAKFTHENEIARAHYYSVLLNEGTAASGVRIEVTPTSHAAYVRITFPGDAANRNVIFDSLWGSSADMLSFSSDCRSFTALTNHVSAGGGKMYVVGTFDDAWKSATTVKGAKGIASFDGGTTVVTMKIATSFLSYEQARHNMELEIGDMDFDAVMAAAQGVWDALCGKFEIEGATYTQLVNFYSALYRMYAYPNLYSENEGSNENPVWVYASPYHSGAKTSGFFYTNNGFWDTYRTTWAGYSLFTAEKDGEMLDGIVQHYIDSGWIPRWICPGGVNCMVGTSSDIIFADAFIKGIDFNYEKAWESMIENASAYSSNMTAGGRPANNVSPYIGYVPNNNGSSIRGEAYSSSIESCINDYGLYRMAEKLGLTAEAEYYLDRCMKYQMLFNAEADFFMGLSDKGVYSADASNYDPAAWGGPKGDYTESVGWVNAFPAVFDGEGLAALYGGREALAAKLNTMFDDSIESMRKVINITGHEMREFKEVKMGQYEHNNQPSHHVIYTYAFSSEPWRVQEYAREVLRHVYVGSEIGQGLPGDEDNGEMSAWYVFNALGFYPYCLASGEYVIGSPLFPKVTVHFDNGNDLVIIAHNNSQENVYIRSAKVNGESYDKLSLTHEMITSGCVIEYEMGDQPSSFGSSDQARPSSLSQKGKVRSYESDLAGQAKINYADYTAASEVTAETEIFSGASSKNYFDNNSLTGVTTADGKQVVLTGTVPGKLSYITVSSYAKTAAPTGVKIEASDDGVHYRTLAEKELSFLFDKFAVPVEIPEAERGYYLFYRVTFTGGGRLSELEFIGSKAIKGDIDFSQTLGISDVTMLLDLLASGGASADYVRDVSGDGTLSIEDVTALLDILAGS